MNSEKAKNLIGRVLISAIFIYSIPNKVLNFQKTFEILISKNIPELIAPFLLLTAILFLTLGSILFISGFKQSLGGSLLLLFIVPTTIIFSSFPFPSRKFINECWIS